MQTTRSGHSGIIYDLNTSNLYHVDAYEILPKTPFLDKRLSLPARGLMALIYMAFQYRPFAYKDIAELAACSDYTLRKVMGQLRRADYVRLYGSKTWQAVESPALSKQRR